MGSRRSSIAALQTKWGLTEHAARHLHGLLSHFPGVRVTSGRRTPEHNRRVGGVENSFHLSGRAVDVVVPASARSAFIEHAKAQRVSPSCTGPEEVIRESDHIHLAW